MENLVEVMTLVSDKSVTGIFMLASLIVAVLVIMEVSKVRRKLEDVERYIYTAITNKEEKNDFIFTNDIEDR